MGTKKAKSSSETPTVRASEEVLELIDALDFSPENVIGASSQQPKLFLKAVDYRITCMRRRIAAESKRDAMRVEVATAARSHAELAGVRATEAYISEKVGQNEAYITANESYLAQDTEEEYAKLLVEAYRMRRDCLKIVGDLMWAERSAERAREEGAAQLDEVRRRVREKYNTSR